LLKAANLTEIPPTSEMDFGAFQRRVCIKERTLTNLPAYAEEVLSGANTFALSYAAKNVTASRSELGLRTDKSFVLTDAILTLRGRAAWASARFNPNHPVVATFQSLPAHHLWRTARHKPPPARLSPPPLK
jgi:Autotransporter beta-domain